MREDFCYDVNFTQIIHPLKQLQTISDVLCKAYHAGVITTYGKAIIFGTGAERGTWGQFANVHLNKIDFFNARESLTWFSNIYSIALRNQGKTTRKRNFYLSQMQEIKPLLNAFGLEEEFNQQWEDVYEHDTAHDLKSEWENCGKISNWVTRTKIATINFAEQEMTILDSITEHLLTNLISGNIMRYVKDPEQLIGNAFIEGRRGLTLTLDDLSNLMINKRIA